MDELRGVEYLRRKLSKKKKRVDLRYRYYEMKEKTIDRGITIPYWLKGQYRSTVGWCTKSVDSLADRLNVRGIRSDTDYYAIQEIFDMNNPDIFYDSAIREALIGACSFVHISHGEGEELTPRLSVLTAKDATGIIDEFTGLLKEGYAILSKDRDGKPLVEAYFTPEATYYFERGVEDIIEENPTGIPLLVAIPVGFATTIRAL